MSNQQQFSLRWTEFESNLVTCFTHLRTERTFSDVTLGCEGQTLKAHKMVLSACSPFFKSLLEKNPSKHPIIILKDVRFNILQLVVEWMYTGKVDVPNEDLSTFIKTGDKWMVKGLDQQPTPGNHA